MYILLLVPLSFVLCIMIFVSFYIFGLLWIISYINKHVHEVYLLSRDAIIKTFIHVCHLRTYRFSHAIARKTRFISFLEPFF